VQSRAGLAVEEDAEEAINCKNLTVFEPPSTDCGGNLRLPCGGKSYKEQRSARTSPGEADLEGCEDSISSHFRFDKCTINESVLGGHREHGSGRQPLIEENSEEDENVAPAKLGLGEDVFHNEGSALSQHRRSRLRGSWRVSEDKATMAESEVATLELRLQTKEGEVVNLLAELRAREKEVHDLRTEVWRWRRMAEMPHAFSTGAGASDSEYMQKTSLSCVQDGGRGAETSNATNETSDSSTAQKEDASVSVKNLPLATTAGLLEAAVTFARVQTSLLRATADAVEALSTAPNSTVAHAV